MGGCGRKREGATEKTGGVERCGRGAGKDRTVPRMRGAGKQEVRDAEDVMKQGEKRERRPGGAQEARRGKRWERVLEGGWTMERAEGQTCRNGMRGGGAESRMPETPAFEAEQPRAARKRVLHRIHDGPFGSIPRLPLGMRDKQIKGAGKLFLPAGCGAESRMPETPAFEA